MGGSAAPVAGPHGSGQGCGNMLNPLIHNPPATLALFATSSAAVSMPTRYTSLDITNTIKTNKHVDRCKVQQYDAAFSETLIRSKMRKMSEGGLWACSDCSHTSSQAAGMRNHVESHHVGGTGYVCGVCNRFCRTKNALDTHRSRYKHF